MDSVVACPYEAGKTILQQRRNSGSTKQYA